MEKAKWVVAAVAFVNALCYSACFPSLAPFAERLSGIMAPTAGTASLLGVIVALFPLSKAATAPLAGRAAARFGIRATLLVQQAVLIVGSVVYATAATTGMLCTSRVLLGSGQLVEHRLPRLGVAARRRRGGARAGDRGAQRRDDARLL